MQSIFEFAGYATIAGALLHASFASLRALGRWRREVSTGHAEQELFRKHAKETLYIAQVNRVREQTTWNGYRKFYIDRKVPEPGGVCSFYLKPHDHRPIPPFEPGQFLTFRLKIPGQVKPVIRCYSLSDSPLERDYYRVSIKKVPPPMDRPDLPPGLSSNFFHDHLNVGDVVDVAAPNGHFFMDTKSERPVVLIGGGVGLTPVLSMLNTIALSESKRETWFFYGVRNKTEHAMADHLRSLTEQHDNINLAVCYSQPTEECVEGHDYQVEGFVSVDLFKSLLPSSNYEFYVCGPPPMMSSITGGLEAWGVPEEDINFEAFGPATVKKTPVAEHSDAVSGTTVTFDMSGKSVTWNGDGTSILELAEQNGIDIDSGCRAGNCGTCVTAIKSGKVKYISEPGSPQEEGTCLVCIAVPDGDVTFNI